MDNYILPIICSVVSVIFLFVTVFLNNRGEKSIITGNKTDKDFVDKAIEYKKKQLSETPYGLKFTTYIFLLIASPIVLGVTSFLLTKNVLVCVLLTVLGICVPELLRKATETKQKSMFEERYCRALRQLASSLSVGLTIRQAVSDLCTNPFIHSSIIAEFKQIDAEIKVGIPIPDAFGNMYERVQNNDVKDVAATITMQTQIGGSEADAIKLIADNIQTRIDLRKEQRSLFAGAKTTAIGIDITTYLITVLTLASGGNGNFYLSKPIYTVILILLICIMIIGSAVNIRLISKSTRIEG